MAERVYRKKSTADVPSASIPDVSATVPKVEMPQQSVVASSSAAGTGQRIFKKKAATSATQGLTAQPTSRVYSVRPEVKAARAGNLQAWFDEADSLIRSTQDYIATNRDKYNREYGAEYQQKIDQLTSRANEVEAYLDYYQSDPDAHRSLTAAFGEIKQYLRDFGDHAASVRDYYGSWDDEEAYNETVSAAKRKEELLATDREALASEIQYTQDLIALIDEYWSWENQDPQHYYGAGEHGAAEVGGKRYDLQQKMAYYGISPDDKKSLEAKLKADQETYRSAGIAQEEARILGYVAEAKADPDYEQYLQVGRNVENPTAEETYPRLYLFGWQPNGEAEKPQNPVTFHLENQQALQASAAAGGVPEFYDEFIFQMTGEQVDNYNYIFGKYGREEADKYLELLRSDRKVTRSTEFFEKYLENKWYEGVYSVVQGLDQFGTGLQAAFGNDSTEKRTLDPQLVGALVREDIGEGAPEFLLGSSLGQMAYDFGTTSSNMIPSIGAGALANVVAPGSGAYVTPTLMGLSSGGNAYKDALNRGYTEEQARTYGTLIGTSEALLGKLLGSIGPAGKSSVGTMLQNATDGIKNAALRFAAQMGGRMISEAAEEGLQEILTPFFENIALDADNTWEDIDWKQAGYSAVMGALSSFAMDGGSSVASVAVAKSKQNALYRSVGAKFINAEGGVTIDDAIAIGLSNAKGTDAYKAAVKIQEKVKAGETVTPYAVGRMVAESQTEQAQTARAIEREVLESGRRVGYDAEAVEQISQAAVALNLRVRFAAPNEMTNENYAGEYHSGTDTVVLNSAVKNVELLMGYVMGHETAHSAEGTKQMDALKKLAIRSMGADEWAERKADTQKKYAAAGATLSPAQVEKEALADWIGENLFKKGFVQAVVSGDATTGGTFLYLLDRVRRVFATKNSLSNNVAMLERLFMQAIEARDTRIVTDGEGVQGSIGVLPNGRQYINVDVDQSLFDGLSSKEKLKMAELVIRERFVKKVIGDAEHPAYVTKDAAKEYAYPAKPLKDKDVIDAKARVSTELDDLLRVAYDWSHHNDGEDGHTHPDAVGGFDHATVLFKVGSSMYVGRINVKITARGRQLKDVTQIRKATTGDYRSNEGTSPPVSRDSFSTTTVAQNDSGVNTQSMQEGDGIFTEDGGSGVQGALLTPDMLENTRAATETDMPAGEGEAVTAPTTPQAPAVAAQVDEAAVLDDAIRSAAQGKVTSQATDVEGIIADLGDEEAVRRMYTAAQMHRPTGMVEVDGRRVDASAYMDAYERSLPDDIATLEATVRELSERRTAEIVRMEQEGTLENYRFGGLKIDLQLFAAQRKWDLLQLDAGENGKKARQFYEKRLRGTDANHNQELVDLLAGRSETYNPIADEVTMDRAEGRLRRDRKYQEKLIRRIGKYDPHDVFTAVDVAAAQVLINDAINEGELEVAADLIAGLSRKGTELGRAVQAFSMMARLTPEGTLRAAIRTVKAEADYVIGEGANEGLDVLADDLVRAITEAAEKGVSPEEMADRIRNGGRSTGAVREEGADTSGDDTSVSRKKKATAQDGEHPTAATVSDDAQADVPRDADTPQGLTPTHDTPTGLRTTPTSEIRPFDKLGAQSGTDSDGDEYHSARVPQRKQSRGELVQLLSENLAAERGNFLSQEEIYDILWKTVEECTNIPQQLKRYVLKKLRKDDGGLAQRIYELHLRGDLKQVRLRRAMESALELPTLTDNDIEWVVKQGEKIDSLKDKPVEQADAMDELYDFLGAKMAVNGWDRLRAWRKFGMLFNAKTHLRNLLSNWAYSGIRNADDAVAMVLERIFVRDPSQRSAALGWSHTEHGQSIMPALQEQAELAVLEMQKRGAKYETGTGQLKQRRKFFGLSKFGEMLNSANRWNSEWLEREDIWFFKPAYIDALGQIMTARGATEVTPELHQLAMQRALEATFRADNMISDVISALKRFQNESTTGKRLFGHAVDVVIPFHKTPANLAAQAVWHSPIGIVKGAFDLYNATRGKGSKDVATAINTMAKGVTGSVLLAIGMLLGSAGLFNTGFGKTEKERAADEMAGLQDGAFVVGGVSVSLDWLQPAASPLIVGASIADRLRTEGLSLNGVVGAVMDGTDSLFELTMLQSLYDILGGYDAGASGTMMSVGENVVSQSVPTLVGQLARAIDPVQRKTKGDTEFETIINQVVAKIPGLTYLLDPELDVWGNVVYRTGKPSAGTAVLNAGQQFIIPANTKVGTGFGDPISQEILRLYEVEGGAVIPSAASRDDAKEAGVDYVDVNRLLGGVNRLAVEEFIGNEKPYDVMVETGQLTAAGNPQKKKVTKYYREMSDEERRKVLARIYENSKGTVLNPPEGSKMTDTEAYFYDLIRRVRGGERGTFTTEEAQPKEQQKGTSYFEDLIRRMRNGN